jgi:hypothetical protein
MIINNEHIHTKDGMEMHVSVMNVRTEDISTDIVYIDVPEEKEEY